MLERFNVPDEKAVLVPVDSMRAVVHELFLACGLDQDGAHGSLRPSACDLCSCQPPSSGRRQGLFLPFLSGAATCADVLIVNDLRGNESHGVSNQLRAYVTGFQRGEPRPASDGLSAAEPRTRVCHTALRIRVAVCCLPTGCFE